MSIDPKRTALMSRIRSTDTRPEILVRQALHSRGLRFRLHRKDLPGRPDVVLPRHRLIILVHGCFWHQHLNCRLASKPKLRVDYWTPKLARNIERDKAVEMQLQELGWHVETIWECETRDDERLACCINRIVSRMEQRSGANADTNAASSESTKPMFQELT